MWITWLITEQADWLSNIHSTGRGHLIAMKLQVIWEKGTAISN